MCFCIGAGCDYCDSGAVVGVCRICADCELYRVQGNDFRFMCALCVSHVHHTIAEDNDIRRQDGEALMSFFNEDGEYL